MRNSSCIQYQAANIQKGNKKYKEKVIFIKGDQD